MEPTKRTLTVADWRTLDWEACQRGEHGWVDLQRQPFLLPINIWTQECSHCGKRREMVRE